MLKTGKMKAAAALLSMMLLTNGVSAASIQAAPAITAGTTHVILYLNQSEAFLNGEQVLLEAPATVKGGKTFVPIKFLGDAFGIKVEWQQATNSVLMVTSSHEILVDLKNKQVWVNGLEHQFEDAVMIVNGKLMLKLTWLSDYVGAAYSYNQALKRVDVYYVNKPGGVYDPDKDNSIPVAKFAFGKSSYRIGEPVKYINLSYDLDAEGLKLEWQGNEEAFFKTGTYPVTLTVVDRSGNRSAPYTRNVVVEDSVYLSEVEYPVFRTPVGQTIPTDWLYLHKHYFGIPNLAKTITTDTSRTLLMSDSPETFTETGVLYQDFIDGKGRLYADHFNGMTKKTGFAIMATNVTDQPVQVKTTNKGEVYPSIYANLAGSEATIDFLLNDDKEESMTIPAGKTFVYKQFPDFYPGQGVNLIYDVETNGKVQFTFVAADKIDELAVNLPKLAFTGHIRGTFQGAGFDWQVDLTAANLKEPKKLVFGEGTEDPFLKGYDPLRGEETYLKSNYGTVYRIQSDKPAKMAIMLIARGGPFKGPFKINGEMIKAPATGTLTTFDGMVVLARTTGKEDKLEIEYSPPAGSGFPINLIFYPLDERAN